MAPRFAAGLLLLALASGCAGEAPATGPGTCSAWHCDLPVASPLAWTRPAEGGGPLDISQVSILCERHAAQSPFVLAGRWIFMVGIVPALGFAYLGFRVLWIFDRYGPGLGHLGETAGRRVLFGIPAMIAAGWLVFFLVRAW